MRMLFVSTNAGQEVLIHQLATVLDKRDVEVLVLTADVSSEQALRRVGRPVRNAHRNAHQQATHEPFSAEKLERLVEWYQLDLPRITGSQRARFHRPEEATEKLVYYLVQEAEAVLDEFHPDLVVTFDRHPLDIVVTAVADKRGVPMLFSSGSSVVPNTHWWGTFNLRDWLRTEILERPLTTPEAAAVARYIEQTLREKPVLFAWFFRQKLISVSRARRSLWYTRNYLRNIRYNPSIYPPWRYVWFHLTFYLFTPFKRPFYQAMRPHERFFFLPLHQMEDYGLTYAASQLGGQDQLVERIAAAMPKGVTLYVKEHPNPLWPIPVEWVRRIAALPNVRLLPPQLNAHEIIAKAEAIVTIMSDVGWEALLQGKPVITLGSSFYTEYDVTLDVRDLTELPAVLAAVANGAGRPAPERVQRLVAAVLGSVYPGTFTAYTTDPKAIIDGLLAEYKRRQLFVSVR